MLAESKRTHLNRALSKLGYCSRTVGEQWISMGRVRVNGAKAIDPEQWVEIGTDNIEVTGSDTPGAREISKHVRNEATRKINLILTLIIWEIDVNLIS